MIINLKKGFTQQEFDEALNELQENVLTGGKGQIQEINDNNPNFPILLVDGYWDIGDEGKPEPCFWYSKAKLNERVIRYEV